MTGVTSEIESGPRILAVAIRENMDRLVDLCVRRIREDIAEYHGEIAAVPEIEEEMRGNVLVSLTTFTEILDGSRTALEKLAADNHTQRRIDQGIPADFILRALSSATLALWAWLVDENWMHDGRRDVVSEGWPMWLTFVNDNASRVSHLYQQHELARVADEATARSSALSDILERRVSGPSARRSLERMGVEHGQGMLLVIIRRERGHSSDSSVSATTRSVANSIDRHTGVRPVVAIRSLDTVLLCSSRSYPAEELRTVVAAAMRTPAEGPAADRVVVSRVFDDVDDIAEVHSAARRALDVAGLRSQPFLMSEVGLLDYVANALGSDIAYICPASVRSYLASGTKDLADSLATMETWVNNNMNVKQTAASLHVHVNTVYYRLAQVEKAAGIDPHDVQDCLSLILAARLRDRL